MTTPLLHLIPTAAWRECLAVGAVAPTVAEFVHLSTAEQVVLPAGRLFAGRPDLLLLAIDPERVGVPVRWEPGLPTDPADMRFPHAYGPVPTAAVLAVVPYRPRADGGFDVPRLPVLDAAGRQAEFEPSYLRRAASVEIPVTGGVAVRTDSVRASHHHNRLLIDGDTDATTFGRDVNRALDGYGQRSALLIGAHHANTATKLGSQGWTVKPLVGMAESLDDRPVIEVSGRCELVGLDALRSTWTATSRRTTAGGTDELIAGLVDRYKREERVIDVQYLAGRDRTGAVAYGVLRIDGATAELAPVETFRRRHRRRHSDAMLGCARRWAKRAGCTLLTLTAAAEGQDQDQEWLGRRGFVVLARIWAVEKPRSLEADRK